MLHESAAVFVSVDHDLQKHFEPTRRCAYRVGDATLEVTLQLLYEPHRIWPLEPREEWFEGIVANQEVLLSERPEVGRVRIGDTDHLCFDLRIDLLSASCRLLEAALKIGDGRRQ